MQIQDFKQQISEEQNAPITSQSLPEALGAALIFLIPILILFVLAS